jgi:inhibitor of apoptosis-promoting Bax1
VYTGISIAQTFFIAAAMFLGMSLYGNTGKSLEGFGPALFMGLIGIVIASVVNLFLGSSNLEIAISIIGIIVFAGLTAWDTQRLKATYVAGLDRDLEAKSAILGALTFYLDFINLFLMLIRPSSRLIAAEPLVASDVSCRLTCVKARAKRNCKAPPCGPEEQSQPAFPVSFLRHTDQGAGIVTCGHPGPLSSARCLLPISQSPAVPRPDRGERHERQNVEIRAAPRAIRIATSQTSTGWKSTSTPKTSARTYTMMARDGGPPRYCAPSRDLELFKMPSQLPEGKVRA